MLKNGLSDRAAFQKYLDGIFEQDLLSLLPISLSDGTVMGMPVDEILSEKEATTIKVELCTELIRFYIRKEQMKEEAGNE